jgi:hypothetical protein
MSRFWQEITKSFYRALESADIGLVIRVLFLAILAFILMIGGYVLSISRKFSRRRRNLRSRCILSCIRLSLPVQEILWAGVFWGNVGKENARSG